MNREAKSSEDLESLVQLARRFTAHRRWQEAAELFEVALHLDPQNLGVKIALAELRKREAQLGGGSPKTVRETLLEQQRRDSIDAAHFLGLAHLYAEKGENASALECLQVAAVRRPTDPSHLKLRGRILFRRQEFEAAAEELRAALRLNPFDREIAETLGRAEYECRRFEAALRSTAHAYLLLHEADEEGAGRLRRRVRMLKQILGWGSRELTRVFRDREEHLHVAFDRLEWHRERFREQFGLPGGGVFLGGGERPGRVGQIDMAARLRRLEVWSHLSDEQVFHLASVVDEEVHDLGERVFAHGSQGRDLYLVETGEIAVQRSTPYGNFVLATLGPSALLGEVNFLSRCERSGDAVVSRAARLLRFDAEELDRLLDTDPELGVQLLWSFWHALASKLRSTNEQLRSFFSEDVRPENFVPLRRQTSPTQDPLQRVAVERSDKVRLFRETGLSGRELTTLATFSREKRFAAEAYLFQEGDEGAEMYVILEGRVRISKHISGAGEEALAILGRGDFFGEMALIDGAPRSADARAHGGQVTVLALDEATVQEVLSMDAPASLEFLRLLCALITHRLREIDEKVIGWRILAGDPPQSASA